MFCIKLKNNAGSETTAVWFEDFQIAHKDSTHQIFGAEFLSLYRVSVYSLCQKGVQVLSLSKWLYTIISASESSSESPIANLNSIRVRALAPGPLRGKIAPHWKYIYCQWLFFLSYRGAGIRRFNGIQLLDLGISIRWVLEVYIRIFVRVKNRWREDEIVLYLVTAPMHIHKVPKML